MRGRGRPRRIEHLCPGGCGEHVPRHLFACRACWARLPRDLKGPITANYERNPGAHIEAMADACQWYEDQAAARTVRVEPVRPIGPPPSIERLSVPSQRKRMVLLIADAGITDNDQRRAVQAAMAGHPLASSKDLTTREAAAIVQRLEDWRAAGELADRVAELLAHQPAPEATP